MTDYIDVHPGGARNIIQQCGTDATSAYEAVKKHDEDLLLRENALDFYGVGDACS
jgi:cytochrome b involved in lipid metabolism